MAIFGYDRPNVEKRIGHLSQIGGLKLYTLADGRAAGLRAVDFRTTEGLEFTVLLDRCLDISEARYRGMSLCWRSPAGDVAPTYYDARGLEWLRTFFGGLLTTCGLSQVGPPEVDDGDELGLHGRISAAPAEKVSYSEEWQGDRLVLSVSGVVRESSLFGPQLEMRRTISASADGAGLCLRDRITNIGARRSPCMLLYHINTGFPLVDDAAELVVSSATVEPRDDEAREGAEQYARMHAPVSGYKEKVYLHTCQPDADGRVTAAVVNRALRGGLALRLRWRADELPCLTEWKMMGEREYVLGVEPGNCFPLGRSRERQAGRLVELEVGECIEAGFEIDVVEGAEGIDELVREASGGR